MIREEEEKKKKQKVNDHFRMAYMLPYLFHCIILFCFFRFLRCIRGFVSQSIFLFTLLFLPMLRYSFHFCLSVFILSNIQSTALLLLLPASRLFSIRCCCCCCFYRRSDLAVSSKASQFPSSLPLSLSIYRYTYISYLPNLSLCACCQ